MLRNMSLVARLSLIFFAFTLVNIMLFWLATGSNQMRLIAEKSTLEMHRSIIALREKLASITTTQIGAASPDYYRHEKARQQILTAFENRQKVVDPNLIEFAVIGDTSLVYTAWPPQKNATTLSADETQNLIKTLRLKEFNNEPFYSAPDILNYRLVVYIPFLEHAGQNLILRASFQMQNMQNELARLMRLGVSIVLLLLVVQAALGFFLYRLLVRPLKALRIASTATGRGDYYQIAGYTKRRDEIGSLVATFNKMSTDIRDQKETIRKNYEEIKQRDETMQHELMIAQHIQKSIFPKGEYPHRAALEYKPLFAVSGDFYDVYKFPDGSIGYLVCDASGHGVPAALLTMMAKTAFAAAVQHSTDPATIMRAVNAQIAASLDMTGQYLTAFFMRILTTQIEYCNATHPEPIVLKQSGALTLKSNGFYVGMMVDTPFEFETATVALEKGARIVLFTDGITEARNTHGELFGSARLIESATELKNKSALEIRDGVLASLSAFVGATPAEDDLTLLVLEL